MKLSIVIVNYNVKHYLEQCLQSLFRALEGIEAEVIVVDNHSHDESVAFLRASYPMVHLICSNHNLGFSRGNNLALHQCKGEYVLLLNPDTIVGEHTLRDVLSFMEKHPDAGTVGVKMLKADGTVARESRRGVPTPMVAFYKMMGLCDRYPYHPRLGHYYMGNLPWDQPCEIEIVSGAFCMMRRDVLEKVGLLDETFFMYGEDIDLSYRMLKAGYHNYYVPTAILHYKGESTQKTNFRYVHVFYDAMLIFFQKHFAKRSIFLSVPIKLAIYAKATLALIQLVNHYRRKQMGFVVAKKQMRAHYVFVGSEFMLEECKAIANSHGLSASFVTLENRLDSQTYERLVEECNQQPTELTYLVFDVERISYNDIFERIENTLPPHTLLGTYSCTTHKLITPSEIFIR